MNPTLIVLSSGKWQGKVIDILRAPFLIGRGEGCALRPSSRHVGERHCAILLQDGKAFVEDLHGCGDTFLDDQPIQGKAELRSGHRLRVGPLLFEVRLPQSATETLPLPSVDEEAAALLLDGHQPTEEDGWTNATPKAFSAQENLDPRDPGARAAKTSQKAAQEDTTQAAKDLLKKYGKVEGLRAPRRIR